MRFRNDEASIAYGEYLDALEYDEELSTRVGHPPERTAESPADGGNTVFRTAPTLQ